MKQAGYGRKMSNDSLVYIIIIIIVGAFVYNLDNIYNFFDTVSNDGLFKKNENSSTTSVVTKSEDNVKYEIVTPVGKSNVVCERSLTVNKTDSKKITVYLYHTNDKMKSIKQEIKYDGISDSYSNYLFSENSNYENLKKNNIKVAGFSVVSKMDSASDLEASIVVDLSRASFSSIQDKNKIIKVSPALDDDLNEVKDKLIRGGYTCE